MKADTPPRAPGARNDKKNPRRPAARKRAKPAARGWTAGRVLAWVVGVPLALVLALGLTGLLAAVLTANRLPSIAVLTDYRPKVPMHVYTSDGVLIGEYGEERRSVVRIADFPEPMRQAILAAEDDAFYEHSGVDLSGIVRAAIANLRAGGRAQGASTITMQVARNFFLTRERSYVRKIYEVLLTWKIEQALTKDQILEIYAN